MDNDLGKRCYYIRNSVRFLTFRTLDKDNLFLVTIVSLVIPKMSNCKAFEQSFEKVNYLFTRTNLKEVNRLSRTVHLNFSVNRQPCIYDPDTFREFCISFGAPTIFDSILASVIILRKSEKKMRKRMKNIQLI